MVRVASIFGQLLSLFPRTEFQRAVKSHRAERYTKGFACWDQFVAMLFWQLAQAHSLREICGGLACCLGKLTHLRVRTAPNKSTLSYANAHRPWELYQEVFGQLLGKCQAIAPKKTFRFRNKLYSLDSTESYADFTDHRLTSLHEVVHAEFQWLNAAGLWVHHP